MNMLISGHMGKDDTVRRQKNMLLGEKRLNGSLHA